MTTIDTMLTQAKAAQQNAYAPYSHFHVGVCLRTDNNHLFAGCNIENVSYGLTMCAENSAVGQMVSAGERNIAEVLVIGSAPTICAPCGRCRQLLLEFAEPSVLIHLCNQNADKIETHSLAALLPHAFSPRSLENTK